MSEDHLNADKEEILNELETRKQKLMNLRNEGFNFPNHFRRKYLAENLNQQYVGIEKEVLEKQAVKVAIAGRIISRRIMGKASFFHIQDVSGRIQAYARKDDLGGCYDQFRDNWDVGDIVGIEGELFKTKTDELTVAVHHMELLTKSLRPIPKAFYGLADQETRYRKRYVDLIANEESRKLFVVRSKLIKACRQFMESHQFLEVETPMMHSIPGGALARPFITYHNTLDMEMYLRIAPELYLKRLVVGGFERVYEINRNFRNEGLSTRHNPEFTMMEFYQAYVDYTDLMTFTEELMHYLCDTVIGERKIVYQNQELDFSRPFPRMSVKEAILAYNNKLTPQQLDSLECCRALLDELNIAYKENDPLGKLQVSLFEETVEEKIVQPTFITEYPIEVSPLARRSSTNQGLTDRFELFIAGREIANGFSELNDAEDQAARFQKQVDDKNAGDMEAMCFDHDYIEALEYGLPPTAGEGIGIDRLVMLFTNSQSIRDVLLFPQLRQID